MNQQRQTDKCSRKNDNQELQNPKPPLTCSHKASERASCQKNLPTAGERNPTRKKKLHKKRAEVYTKTEATELKEPDDKHSWKKERKKERTRYTTKTTTIRAAAVCRVLKTQQPTKKKKKQLTLKRDSKKTSWD